MVGEGQAEAIEARLRRRLDPADFEERRLLCGNPPHFQGDERDVIFLSMVDSSHGGPMRLRDTAMYKKRFNVAASRARDQMWVVHSMDPEDLRTEDLRRRLIEYARNPKALEVALEEGLSKAESEFEKDVLRRLIAAGYRVIPQYVFGPYRIDIIVEDGKKRLAVECDGEQFHTILDLEKDMERQSQLERAGLKFHRIRGARYYRDPENEFALLVRHLTEMDIHPSGFDTTAKCNSESDLLARIIARAKALREYYADNEELFYGMSNQPATVATSHKVASPSRESTPKGGPLQGKP